ncbi:hypothetical protein BGZ94_008231 [Podila epigama]|nr:hypothetical protein BGZ94_008231 [Podila epigama]
MASSNDSVVIIHSSRLSPSEEEEMVNKTNSVHLPGLESSTMPPSHSKADLDLNSRLDTTLASVSTTKGIIVEVVHGDSDNHHHHHHQIQASAVAKDLGSATPSAQPPPQLLSQQHSLTGQTTTTTPTLPNPLPSHSKSDQQASEPTLAGTSTSTTSTTTTTTTTATSAATSTTTTSTPTIVTTTTATTSLPLSLPLPLPNPHLAANNDNNSSGKTKKPRSDLDSSAVSVLSASGTLVPPQPLHNNDHDTRPSTHLRPHFTRSTTTLALTDQDNSPFDLDHYKALLKELAKHTETLENLNDQALNVLTDQEDCHALLHHTRAAQAQAQTRSADRDGDPDSGPDPGPEQKPEADHNHNSNRNRHPNLNSSRDHHGLDNARQLTTLAIADIVLTAWPELCRTSWPAIEAGQHRVQMSLVHSSKQNKQRLKIAKQMQAALVAFWSVQDRYQDCVQLVLEAYQDPEVLEQEERIQILRSRYLDNLLSSSLGYSEAKELEAIVQAEQERMTVITEPLRTALLSMMVAIGEAEQCQAKAATSTRTAGCRQESFGRRLAQFGRSKTQAFKDWIKS